MTTKKFEQLYKTVKTELQSELRKNPFLTVIDCHIL